MKQQSQRSCALTLFNSGCWVQAQEWAHLNPAANLEGPLHSNGVNFVHHFQCCNRFIFNVVIVPRISSNVRFVIPYIMKTAQKWSIPCLIWHSRNFLAVFCHRQKCFKIDVIIKKPLNLSRTSVHINNLSSKRPPFRHLFTEAAICSRFSRCSGVPGPLTSVCFLWLENASWAVDVPFQQNSVRFGTLQTKLELSCLNLRSCTVWPSTFVLRGLMATGQVHCQI